MRTVSDATTPVRRIWRVSCLSWIFTSVQSEHFSPVVRLVFLIPRCLSVWSWRVLSRICCLVSVYSRYGSKSILAGASSGFL